MPEFVAPSPLPPINRYITTNDSTGKAVLSKQVPAASTWTAAGKEAKFFLGYCTTEFPVNLEDSKDVAGYESYLASPPGLVIPGGNVLRVVDMAPGITSPMHRTSSLDYGVVLEGEVELLLDSGEKQLLNKGDIVVQRLTNHAWRNASETEWARMLYVLTEAKALTVGGKELGEDLGGMHDVRKSG